MATRSSGKHPRFDHYYYADGEPVELAPVRGVVAVDQNLAESADLTSAARSELKSASQQLKQGLALADEKLVAPMRQMLEKALAIQPVFESHGAMLVAMPEVRVEDESAERRDAVLRWIGEHADFAEIVSSEDERIVLRPLSGKGGDALDLANRLTEDVHPALCQSRFVRVVKRPGSSF